MDHPPDFMFLLVKPYLNLADQILFSKATRRFKFNPAKEFRKVLPEYIKEIIKNQDVFLYGDIILRVLFAEEINVNENIQLFTTRENGFNVFHFLMNIGLWFHEQQSLYPSYYKLHPSTVSYLSSTRKDIPNLELYLICDTSDVSHDYFNKNCLCIKDPSHTLLLRRLGGLPFKTPEDVEYIDAFYLAGYPLKY